jgi:hypothetical protein
VILVAYPSVGLIISLVGWPLFPEFGNTAWLLGPILAARICDIWCLYLGAQPDPAEECGVTCSNTWAAPHANHRIGLIFAVLRLRPTCTSGAFWDCAWELRRLIDLRYRLLEWFHPRLRWTTNGDGRIWSERGGAAHGCSRWSLQRSSLRT